MHSVSRLNDSIDGMTTGEHSGHTTPHSPSEITGNISGACSSNVFANGIAVAKQNSTTTEYDECCGSNSGVVTGCSSNVIVNGVGIARVNDTVTPHNGTAHVTGGSSNVFAN